ncbi:MAG: carbon-nitrogen hydrolase family protein [Nocardioides sp.]|uniref:carbon-nitrogen hydrolase family protein n=1 Tax=Nocardioides sp. TaxID=35761 RepID=UPI0032634E0F
MGETVNRYRVAAVQAEPAWMDLAEGVAKTVKLLREASAAGADLVAFPEVWLPGYPLFLWLDNVAAQADMVLNYHTSSARIDGPELEEICAAARESRIAVLLGFSERDGGSLYISQVLIDHRGEIVLHRRKLKPTHVERSLFGEGDGSDLAVVDTRLGRIGALSCAEHLQPLSKYAMYAQNEQVHIASWPCFGLYRDVAYAFSPEANLAASQVYSLEGGCYSLVSTQVISQAWVERFAPSEQQRRLLSRGGGFARIFAPDGRPLTEPIPETEEGMVLADVDLDLISLAKNAFDPAGHYARGDATRLVHDRRPRRAVIVVHEPAVPDASPTANDRTESPATASAPQVATTQKEHP